MMSERGAILSDDGRYRYRLHRRVTASDRIALFIMLNPSTADAERDDPTIRRCMGFARALDCGVLVVANLFAYRTKSPKVLLHAPEPIGPENDKYLGWSALDTQLSGGLIICAWGAHGKHLGRDGVVGRNLCAQGFELHSLAETSAGAPRHPLYLAGNCKPLPWSTP